MFPLLTRDDVYRIETARLWLRWPRAEDAVSMAKWVGRPEVATMTSSFKVGMTEAEIAARLAQARETNTAGKSIALVLTPKGEDGHAIGMAGVNVRADGALELGYHLDPAYWSRGLMTEAVRALGVHVFELSAVCKVVASVRPDNHGSIKVLTRSGFASTGGGEHTSALYGRYMVRHFARLRLKPSALAEAQVRFGGVSAVPACVPDLVGLV
jgi:RimJ/RimL family protein N-acetyltransferase